MARIAEGRSLAICFCGVLTVASIGGPARGADSTAPSVPQTRLECDVLVTQLPLTAAAEQPQPVAGTFRTWYGTGARIVRISNQPGPPRNLTAAFHSACDPDVSFDGKRLLFAAKRRADDPWNIYEMNVDGSQLRQITTGLGDCRSPGYQSIYYEITEDVPWQQITFVRVDSSTTNEVGSGPVSSLYSCKLDGSRVRRLTYNLSSDYDPAIMWDGRLLYASWRRAGLERGTNGRIEILGLNTDGADCAAFLPDLGKRVKQMPCTTTSGRAIFVEADRVPWDGAGQLSGVRLRRPLHSYQPITAESDGLFHSPSPLPDGSILVSRRPVDGSGTHGVYRLVLEGRSSVERTAAATQPSGPRTPAPELVFDDPQWHDIQAKAIATRPEPDGRSSSMNVSDSLGKLYCLDVYTSDLKAPQAMPLGVAKRIRIIEGLARKAESLQGAAAGQQPAEVSPLAPRRILGEAPIVEEHQGDVRDYYETPVVGESAAKSAVTGGSFNVEVPANTPIQLQLLDTNGVVLRSCGWIWVRNHQAQGCIGCHEDGELTPMNWQVAALWQPSAQACPPPDRRATVDFSRDVFPLITKKCIACHDQQGRPPLLTAGPDSAVGRGVDAQARFAYRALLAVDKSSAAGPAYGRYVHPGRARTSPLIWHVFGRNLSAPWDGAAASQPVKPIPPDRGLACSADEQQLLVKWVDLGAPWESGVADSTAATSPGAGTPGGR